MSDICQENDFKKIQIIVSIDRKPYQSKIIERCNWRLNNDQTFKLTDLNRGSLSKYIFDLAYYNFNDLNEGDQTILFHFFEVTNQKDLNQKLKKEKENYGKRISEFLTGKTKKPHNESVLDLSALIVDLEPRPFKRDFNYSTLNVEIIPTPKKKQQKPKPKLDLSILGLVTLFGIVALVCIVAISIHNKSKEIPQETTSQPDITINAEHIIVSDINRIVPNNYTKFFNEEGKPKVWYTSNNGQLELYNTMGIHPQTKQVLQPITKEIIKTVYVEKETDKTDGLQETPQKTKPYLLNTSLENNPNKKQLSLFIVDNEFKLDTDATNTVKGQLKEKKYTITIPLIASNNLNQEVVSNLQSLNKNYFKANLNKYTDYLCLGTAAYNYTQSSISKNLKVCELSINYSIISTKNGEEIDSFSKTISGTGSNKQSAKQNALYKLTL